MSRLALRRRWWLARDRFQRWMWSDGPHPSNPFRRIARRLPLYFSDPDMPSRRELGRILKVSEPTFSGSGFVRVNENTTTGSGSFTFRYNWEG